MYRVIFLLVYTKKLIELWKKEEEEDFKELQDDEWTIFIEVTKPINILL
jgi:hypothetical protein